MDDFIQFLEVRWSDLDPNFHLRHSVYYDFGAYSRISFLMAHGMTSEAMLQYNVGPVLFREECIFRKEIRFGDKVSINIKLDKLKADFTRWTMVHQIFRNNDLLAAIITVDGAWLDTKKRKLTSPPAVFNAGFELMPKTGNFKIM